MDLSIFASSFPVRRFGPSLGWRQECQCLGILEILILHIPALELVTLVSQQRVKGQDSIVPAPSELWLRDLVTS